MTRVHVSTPSRLHFGLLRLHERAGRSFGGLGMMIDRPRVELELAAGDEWRITGPGKSWAQEFAASALARVAVLHKPAAIRMRIASTVPQHRGLGGGTQLALAVAAGVRALVGLPPASAAELAEAVGRGGRSAVGSHGFVHGGLIWERGRIGESGLGELSTRVALPEAWRIVLVAPRERRGLSGSAERNAFDCVPPVPAEVTQRLESLAERQILPAATAGALDEFSEAVYEYGRLSGECFANVQGGPFASADIADCVAAIRALGVRGVGQSSWGPTVFAITASGAAADELISRLHADRRWSACEIETAAPDNRGAVVEVERDKQVTAQRAVGN
jgi:beta-RFAP synthase